MNAGRGSRTGRVVAVEMVPEEIVVEELIEHRPGQHLEHHERVVGGASLLGHRRELRLGRGRFRLVFALERPIVVPSRTRLRAETNVTRTMRGRSGVQIEIIGP